MRHGCLFSAYKSVKGLTVSNPFNAMQHVLLTAITAAIVAFHLCLLIWTGLHCSQGAGYAISACFIRFIWVKSTSPFPNLTSIPAYGCTRASHDFKIRLPSSSVDVYKHSFYERSIPAWNALSADVVSSASYPEFIWIVSFTLPY